MSQSTYLAHDFNLTTVDTRVFAPAAFERIFDTLDGQHPTSVAAPVKSDTSVLPIAVIDTGLAGDASFHEVRALKSAQLVAERLADDVVDAMAYLGTEFDRRTFARHAGRAAAEMLAPVLQPLVPSRRAEIVARAVDPAHHDWAIDLVLDRVGRMLSVYADYLPSPRWDPMVPCFDGVTGARVIGWRGPDGEVVFDLLDTVGPDHPDLLDTCGHDRHDQHEVCQVAKDAIVEAQARHLDEVDEIIRTARDQFGSTFVAARYLPTFQMRHARVFYANGFWDPFGKTALPALRLIA